MNVTEKGDYLITFLKLTPVNLKTLCSLQTKVARLNLWFSSQKSYHFLLPARPHFLIYSTQTDESKQISSFDFFVLVDEIYMRLSVLRPRFKQG